MKTNYIFGFKNLNVFAYLVFLSMPLFSQHANQPIDRSEQRLRDAELVATIEGALFYLYDNQILDRKGKKSAYFDACEEGDGCLNTYLLKLPVVGESRVPIPFLIDLQNSKGEWGSTIHFLPKLYRSKRTPLGMLSSNLFVPQFITYPFLFFREENPGGLISLMLKESWFLDKNYKRGGGYNFWMRSKEFPDFVGPRNLPYKYMKPVVYGYVDPYANLLWKILLRNMKLPPKSWFYQCLDSTQNKTDATAIFNIPDDADDTSVTVAMQKLKTQFYRSMPDSFFHRPENFYVDYDAIKFLGRFRDLNRRAEDGRDFWKGKNSGAFLTWLKDEKLPIFSKPEEGIIPLGVNNVDCVINANVIFVLGVLGWKNFPGYRNAVKLMHRAIAEKRWPECGLYYPQYMMFPYVVSRAYRDGNNPALRRSIKILLRDILKIQKQYAEEFPDKKGAFPGGEDTSDILSTALGLATLLNIGSDIAEELGMEKQYRESIEHAVRYLLREKRKIRIKNRKDFKNFTNKPKYGFYWGDGLFFTSSYWDLAHWRSEPFTAAMVLEALTKYLLNYEDKRDINALKGPRLLIREYTGQHARHKRKIEMVSH